MANDLSIYPVFVLLVLAGNVEDPYSSGTQTFVNLRGAISLVLESEKSKKLK